jgi:hypothetical protein
VKEIPDFEKKAASGDEFAMYALMLAYLVPELTELPILRDCARGEYWAKKFADAASRKETRTENTYALQVTIETFISACKSASPLKQ